MVLSPALPGPAATRPAPIISTRRYLPSGSDSCMSWFPKLVALRCSSIRWSKVRTRRTPWQTCRRPRGPSHVLSANTTQQIDAAFATLERERPDALWVTGSGFFASHSAQIVNLAARSRIPAAYGSRDIVVAGGLMSYAAKVEDSIRQVGVYAGRILKGAKPADLPVVQATTFEFVINLQTARALGIDIPPGVFAIADELGRNRRLLHSSEWS